MSNLQQFLVTNTGSTIGQYYYDGDGKRVKKVVPGTGETTIFAYDAAGKEIAEYSTIVADTSSAKVNYLTSDHLGSPRINTDANGSIISRHDYMPFGEEIATAQRTTTVGYVGDAVRKQFTGYERDAETGLDFAQARMFSAASGRLTSPDRYLIVMEIRVEKDAKKAKAQLDRYLAKPQQWNRYSYVANNPMLYVDPSGETLTLTGSQEDNERIFNLLKDMLGEKAAKNLNYTKNNDGSWTIGYKSGSGGLDIGGTLGVAVEDIIDSSKKTTLEISHTDKLLDYGGARTTESPDNSSITITISADVVATTNSVTKMGNITGTDGKVLTNTLSTVVAHELGHDWGMIRDQFGERYNQLHFWQSGGDLIQQNNDRAVQLENIERQRLGLGLKWRH